MAKIKSIVKKHISSELLWNLAVKDDESYVADNVVVHNCRSLLVPITKYEEWEASETTRDGDDIQSFIEDNKGKGFSTYQITDPGVNIETYSLSEKSEEIHYSKDGKVFQITNVKYTDDDKTKVSSVKHTRIKMNECC